MKQRSLYGLHNKTPIDVIQTVDDASVQKGDLRVAIVQPMRVNLPNCAELNKKN